MTIKIESSFKTLIPALTSEEYELLEKQLKIKPAKGAGKQKGKQ